ncbi:hypothetical protein CQ018_16290 [Arthrobacter sp. MYb227]|uniref:tetratricopeptide repeat protein n=1 Tax=Arthrobacter sp. MYb227 TaxID=1848601 RepID=UPI000CFE0FF5|nr:tetratricopeptide repeat protein [Arthrobacter sp. MYb227]PQZ89102.1 hypothetical protein CQ018_16290 [Arthrobacter sp. MYb227]
MATPITIELLHARVQGLNAASRPAEALDLVSGQVEHLGDDSRFWIIFGFALLAQDRVADAQAAAQQAAQLEPDSARVLNLLICCAHDAGEHERAVELAHQLVVVDPTEAQGHYWIAVLYGGKPQSRNDLERAADAIAHALHLNPMDPEYYRLAALIADLSGKTSLAHEYLRTGLQIDPNNSSLLVASGQIDGAKKVVGERSDVLRSVLAVNPMDSTAQDELSEHFLFRLLSLGRLPWLHAIFAALSLSMAQGLWGVLVSLALMLLFAGLGWRNYRSAASGMPAGYPAEILRTNSSARRGIYLLGASVLGIGLGSVIAAPMENQVPGLLLLGAGAMTGFIGEILLHKSAGAPVGGEATDHDKLRYKHRRFGLLIDGHSPRFWWGLVCVLSLGFSLEFASAATGMALLIGAGWLLGIGWQLLYWVLRMGRGNNPWSKSKSLKTKAKFGWMARAAGGMQGAYYLGLHLIFPALIMSMGISLFIGESFTSNNLEAPVQHIDHSRLAPVVPSPVVPSMDFSIPTLPSFDFDRLTEGTD